MSRLGRVVADVAHPDRVPSSAGASASTSVGSSAQSMTADRVAGARGRPTNTRPVSPESLVVTTWSPTTASPLDSTISGSVNVNATSTRSTGAGRAPSTNGTRPAASAAAAPSRSSSSSPSRGRIAPRRHQVVVLPADRAALAPAPRCGRRAAACCAACACSRRTAPRPPGSRCSRIRRRPERVGEGVGEPLAQDAVPGEHGVRRRGGRPAQLRRDVVVAARRGQHQRRLPARPPGPAPRRSRCRRRAAPAPPRAARSSSAPRDRADHEVRVDPELAATVVVVLPGLLLDVHADQLHRQAAHAGQVPLRRRTSGRRCRSRGRRSAAARRPSGRRSWPLSIASVTAVSSSRRNSSTWRNFACRLGLSRPSASASPSARNSGSSSGSSRSLSRSWPRSGVGRRGPRGGVHDAPRPCLVTRSCTVSVVVSTCQLPNGSSSRSSTASAGGVARPGGWRCAPGSRRTPSPAGAGPP